MIELRHGRDYFSPSQLKKLYISIGQLNAYLKKAFQPTSAMDLGTAIHMRLLEPQKYAKTYVVMDDTDICAEIGGKRPTSTKKYAEWKAKLIEDNKGRILISTYDDYVINKIFQKCAMGGLIDTFMSDGEAEKTVRGVAKGFDDEFEALCIIDYDNPFFSVDLKTTSKPLHKFRYDANELGYDIQASVTNSLNGKEFVFIVVQTVEPFDVGVFTTSEAFMDRGKAKVNTALANYESYEDAHTSTVLNFEL